MSRSRFGERLEYALELVPFVFCLYLVVSRLRPMDGYLGHDYYHAISRLYIGAVHFWHHGLAIPHYTPYLLGGIPFFADPQSYYYSLPQWLTFVMRPLDAVLVTAAIFYVIGYAGCLALFQSGLGFSRRVAHLGALGFVANGFSFAHLFVGHLTHHGFLLLPWLLYLLVRRPSPDRRAQWRAAALFALLVSYLVYSGATHMLVVFAVTLFLASPWLVWFHSGAHPGASVRGGDLGRMALFLAMVAGLVLLACGGKLVAGALYGRNFLQRAVDQSGVSPELLVFQYFWLRPDHTPEYLLVSKQWIYGAWEYVGFMPRGVILLGGLAIFPIARARGRGKFLAMAATLAAAVVVAFLAAGTPLNDQLPLIRSYHNPLKLLAGFIPLLPIAFAYGLDWASRLEWYQRWSPAARTVLFLGAGLVFAFEFWGNSDFFVKKGIGIGYPYRPELWEALRRDPSPRPVRRLISQIFVDEDGLVDGTSSLRAYTPEFGYRLEAAHLELVPGETAMIRPDADGIPRFNITHPGCLIYPGYFGCRPWERIDARDQVNFERFIDGEIPDWGVPWWQRLLLGIDLVSLMAMLLFVAWPQAVLQGVSTPVALEVP